MARTNHDRLTTLIASLATRERVLVSEVIQAFFPVVLPQFRSFPVQDDDHFLTLCRYVESNGLRAGLASRAEDWRIGSFYPWNRSIEPMPSLLSP